MITTTTTLSSATAEDGVTRSIDFPQGFLVGASTSPPPDRGRQRPQ